MDTLPYDCLLSIATQSPAAWFGLVRVSRPLANAAAKDPHFQHSLIKKFIRTNLNGTTILPNGKGHSLDDKPAKIYGNGSMCWLHFGRLHRDGDLPALIINSQSKIWYTPDNFAAATQVKNIFRNNSDAPLDTSNLRLMWYQHGKCSRMAGPSIMSANLMEWSTPQVGDFPTIIYANGTKIWHKNNKIGRDSDLPAVILADGTQKWFKKGLLDRGKDLPAIIYSNGSCSWYRRGLLHREVGPAAIDCQGNMMWYKNGTLFRDGDLPAVINSSSYVWYVDGLISRGNDLPAIIRSDGTLIWCFRGVVHRENHPAVIKVNGETQWYLDGHLIK